MDESTDDNDLYTLVCQSDHANELDVHLKHLCNIDDVLMRLHERDGQSVTLLMLAALLGKDEMVRSILAHSSDVNQLVEIHGRVFRENGTLVRNRTALWCACDRAYYRVACSLIDIGGARINDGTKYSLLMDAIVVGRFDTIRFLIDNAYVDIDNMTDNQYYKLNSLVMAVIHGHTQIVAFLLDSGASFDYTTTPWGNTPLSFAAIKGHLDIVRLLCTAGACSTKKNKRGETPLMLAAEQGHIHVVDYLLERNNDYETSIKELELVACAFIIPTTYDTEGFQKTSNLMHKIFQIRAIKKVPKSVALPIAAYAFHQECQTIGEFTKIEHDEVRLFLEALIVRERLLVPDRDDTLFKPLLDYGYELVLRDQFEHCLHLWEHTFYLYQNMNLVTGLHRFVWVFCKMLSAQAHISPRQFVQICCLTFQPSQQKPIDDCIKNTLCLLVVAVKVFEQPTITSADRRLIYQWINDLCRLRRLTSDGQTLLHLCVDVQTYNDINYRAHDIRPIIIFPNLSVIQLLLTCCSRWIDIDAVESKHGNTALHISCQTETNNSLAVIQMLIDFGAHIDCINKDHQTPFDVTQVDEVRNFLKVKQSPSRLKCMCARLITDRQLPYELLWPKETEMNTFLFLHGGLTNENKDHSTYDCLILL